MRFRPVVILALCAALTPAWAVQPPEGVAMGREPARVRITDPTLQSILTATPDWRAFTAAEGAGWSVRWDQITRTPHRMWGPGLDLGPLRTRDDVERAVLGFVAEHAGLLGLGAAEPTVRTAAYVAGTDAWYVDVDTRFSGLPVWRGGLTFRFSQGLLVMVGADTYPDARFVGDLALSADDAVQAFQAQGPAPRSAHTGTHATAELLPEVVAGRPTLRVVWHVQSRTTSPPGRWHGFVDGRTGELIAFYNDVRFLDGTVQAEVDARVGDGTLELWPLPNASVSDGESTTLTDTLGRWMSVTDTPPTLTLDGPRVRIVDALGKSTPTLLGGDQTLTAADTRDSQAALSAFSFVQRVQDYARTLAPEVSWASSRAVTQVNIDETCNAWFDGTLNFLEEGDGCRNTGRLADVVFHEWGHGFHYYSLLAGTFDGSVGEGAADTMAMLMTDDNRLAPGFFLNGNGGSLRNLDNRAQWPDDYVASEAAVHSNGLMFGGSMWDTRKALARTYGEPDAKDILGRIFVGLLKGGPDLETAYDEAVFADDDDADLGNGTPHQCALVEGFGKHGLGPVGGFGVSPTFDVAWAQPAGVDANLSLTVGNPAPDCLQITPAGGTVHWRRNGDAWQTAWLAADAQQVSAAIPGNELELGDLVEWWAEIGTEEGGTIREPSSGEVRPHTFYVGDVLEVRCQDFEGGDGGYSHQLLSGEDVEGADDWAWGPPAGLAGDPDVAYSGTSVWGNDLGGGEFNGEYQNLKQNRLGSPEIDTAWYTGVFLRYARWLTIEDGLYDRARILADGDEVWSNWESTPELGSDHHLDNRWELHVVDLGAAGDDGKVQLSWEIESDQALAFGGWNIDDVCLFAPATPDNRLGIQDLRASAGPDGVALSWTNPKWAPVRAVRVVRKAGGFPEGADDGTVVFEDDSPELDAAASFVDDVNRKNLHYAVYASDGTTWLSWTREGFNAASLDADGAADGCGCDTSPAGPSTGLLFGLAWIVRRRRSAGPR